MRPYGRQERAAALAHQAAAQEFADALAEDAAARREVAELAARIALTGPAPVVPPSWPTRPCSVHPDMTASGGPLAMQRAINEAKAGNVRASGSACLAEVFGQLPPTPAELTAEAARRRALMAGQQPQAACTSSAASRRAAWVGRRVRPRRRRPAAGSGSGAPYQDGPA